MRALILTEPVESLPEQVVANERYGEFCELMQRYLDLYGFRCMNELKLEEFSLRERPHMVYQVIRNYLLIDDPTAIDIAAIESREQGIRRDADSGPTPRCPIAGFAAPQGHLSVGTEKRPNEREESRKHEVPRTRIYGLVREMLRAIGEHFAREEILDAAEDIFYLTIEEVWDLSRGLP